MASAWLEMCATMNTVVISVYLWLFWCLLNSVYFNVQAFKANVICPNKHQADLEKFYNNRLLESETYIGGHVECLETGVFRSDLPTKFQLEPSAYEVTHYSFYGVGFILWSWLGGMNLCALMGFDMGNFSCTFSMLTIHILLSATHWKSWSWSAICHFCRRKIGYWFCHKLWWSQGCHKAKGIRCFQQDSLIFTLKSSLSNIK